MSATDQVRGSPSPLDAVAGAALFAEGGTSVTVTFSIFIDIGAMSAAAEASATGSSEVGTLRAVCKELEAGGMANADCEIAIPTMVSKRHFMRPIPCTGRLQGDTCRNVNFFNPTSALGTFGRRVLL